MKPYLITEDLIYLLSRWAERSDFRLPVDDFFQDLQQQLADYLRTMFPKVIIIPQADLAQKLYEKLSLISGTTIVSIDQIYNNAEYHLQSNRVADLDTMEVIGETQRPGYPPLIEQVDALPNNKPLTLVDDGCFSGDTLRKIYELFQKRGRRIEQIIVGVLIDRANNHLLERYPDVVLEAIYEFEEVIDWVCERDFFIGVPLSGRTAGRKNGSQIEPYNPEIALPYCLPFGDPIKGASIPTDLAIEFSRFIIEQSIRLWQTIEQVSGKPVLCQDIPRLPKGIKRDEQNFVSILRVVKKKLN